MHLEDSQVCVKSGGPSSRVRLGGGLRAAPPHAVRSRPRGAAVRTGAQTGHARWVCLSCLPVSCLFSRSTTPNPFPILKPVVSRTLDGWGTCPAQCPGGGLVGPLACPAPPVTRQQSRPLPGAPSWGAVSSCLFSQDHSRPDLRYCSRSACRVRACACLGTCVPVCVWGGCSSVVDGRQQSIGRCPWSGASEWE